MAKIEELRKTGKMTARQAGGDTVKGFFESNQQAMAAVLPRHVNADRLLRIAMSALRTTPKLMECELRSLMAAVMVSAQLGLEPNTPLGHAYLIPYEKYKKDGNQWVTERIDVQLIPGYRGLIDLARRSGQIVSIAAHVVHENDAFDYEYGLNETLRHKPALTDKGEMIAVYAVAKLKDGGHQFEVLSKADVDAVREQSKSKKKGPWVTHYDEMARKTAIRRLFKYLPVSSEFATAIALDAKASEGESQNLEAALEGDYSILPGEVEPESNEDATAPEVEATA